MIPRSEVVDQFVFWVHSISSKDCEGCGRHMLRTMNFAATIQQLYGCLGTHNSDVRHAALSKGCAGLSHVMHAVLVPPDFPHLAYFQLLTCEIPVLCNTSVDS